MFHETPVRARNAVRKYWRFATQHGCRGMIHRSFPCSREISASSPRIGGPVRHQHTDWPVAVSRLTEGVTSILSTTAHATRSDTVRRDMIDPLACRHGAV